MSGKDGGYYAIKGFLYQFDKTLIEILQNPDTKVFVEKNEDIDYQDYVIQVKHKETQTFSNHKIKKPVIQLFNLFKKDQSQKFCLFCHFKDKRPNKWAMSLSDLDNILGDKKDGYTDYLKQKFIKSFSIEFSTDYESQFKDLISKIEVAFLLSDKDKAFIYHSIFRSKLLDISIKDKPDRSISKSNLDQFINDTERTIFYDSYAKYLDRKKFFNLIKEEYFTFKTINIDNFERLFVLDCEKDFDLIDLNKIVNVLSNKYFRKSKSPHPYICFLNLDNNKQVELKRDLVDQGLMFNDGTCFNGDKFRLDIIISNDIDNDQLSVKIIDRENIHRVQEKIKIKEIFQFYMKTPLELKTPAKHIKIQIEKPKHVLKMIN